MTTQLIILSDAWQAAGDGSKPVLIDGGQYGLQWCDNAAPVADSPAHSLLPTEEILLPAGMTPQIKRINDYHPGAAVITVYP